MRLEIVKLRRLNCLFACLLAACTTGRPAHLEQTQLEVLLYITPDFSDASTTATRLSYVNWDHRPATKKAGWRSYNSAAPTPTPLPTTVDVSFGDNLVDDLTEQFRLVFPHLKVVRSPVGWPPQSIVLIPRVTSASASREQRETTASLGVEVALKNGTGTQLTTISATSTSHVRPSSYGDVVGLITLPVTLPLTIVGGLLLPQPTKQLLYSGEFNDALSNASSEVSATLASKLESNEIRVALDTQRALQQDSLSFDGHLRQLANKLVSGQSPGAIAVIGFVPLDGVSPAAEQRITSALRTAVAQQRGFTSVQPDLMTRALTQMSVTVPTNTLTDTQLAEFARLVSADFVILGSMTPSGLRIRIDAGMFDVTTGRMVTQGLEEVIAIS